MDSNAKIMIERQREREVAKVKQEHDSCLSLVSKLEYLLMNPKESYHKNLNEIPITDKHNYKNYFTNCDEFKELEQKINMSQNVKLINSNQGSVDNYTYNIDTKTEKVTYQLFSNISTCKCKDYKY